jgi:large subunit ribosomal protein L29
MASKKKNVKELSYNELVAQEKELKQKYMDIRFQKVNGHVDNPMQERAIRREIAKVKTFIRQKELAGQTK